ncbi:MAG TPA: aldehyde dehydrogenase family protein [Pseudonocardia sp.]
MWTQDRDRGLGVARQVQTGTIGINHYLPDVNSPFGGIKASGLGRELGPEALAHYQQHKSIYA